MKDFIEQHEALEHRIRNLQVGVTKPYVHMGGYGRNTRWHTAGLRSAFKVGAAVLRWRVRADMVHFATSGGTILIPSASKTLTICVVKIAGWPTKTMLLVADNGATVLQMNGRGELRWYSGPLGPFTLSGGKYVVG